MHYNDGILPLATRKKLFTYIRARKRECYGYMIFITITKRSANGLIFTCDIVSIQLIS